MRPIVLSARAPKCGTISPLQWQCHPELQGHLYFKDYQDIFRLQVQMPGSSYIGPKTWMHDISSGIASLNKACQTGKKSEKG